MCRVLTACANCLINVVLHLLLLMCPTLHDAALLFQAFFSLFNGSRFAFSCSVLYMLCVLFVVLIVNFHQAEGQQLKISHLANTGTYILCIHFD